MKTWMRRVLGWDLLIASLLLALAAGCVYGTYRWVTDRAETAAVEDAANGAQRDAKRLADYWTTVLERIARLHDMARLVTLAQLGGNAADMGKALAELRLAMSVSIPGIIQISAIDAHGFLAWSTLENPLGRIDLNERRNVKAILHDGRETYIGQPVVGKISGQSSIQFTAATRADDGTLIGLSVVSFDLKRAQELAREIGRDDHDMVTLVRDDGLVLARSMDVAVGRTIQPELTSPNRTSAGKTRFIRGPSQIDGVRRIVARQDLTGNQMSVFVGLAEEAELSDEIAFRRHLGIWAACLYGLLTLLMITALVTLRQHRRIEDQRLQAEAKSARDGFVREIADWSHYMIGVLDEDLRYVYTNEAGERLLGQEIPSLISQEIGAYVEPDMRAELHARLRSLSARGESCLLTFPIKAAGGHTKWMEFESSRIELPSSDGVRRHGWFFLTRDITARKLAEDALRSANDNLRAVVQSSPGFLYRKVLGKTGNPRMHFLLGDQQHFMGYTNEEWFEEGFTRSHVHPDDLAVYDQKVISVARTGKVILEYRLRAKDGHYAWIRDAVNGIPQDDGSYLLSGYALDISAEKEQSIKLEQARRMLSLGELASGIGHEISQPLAVISMAAQNALIILEREPSNTAYLEKALNRIVEFVARASGIIENMRNFGRQDSQTPELIQLSDHVAETATIFNARLEQEKVTVSIDIPQTLPRVRVPPLAFQQVLINLLGNACDAYHGAGVDCIDVRDIQITGRVVDGAVRLLVRDHAGGVPPGVIDRIFEPFFTTKARKRGTGLGLSVCYAIVRKSDGMMAVYNEDGGAVFEITLPIAEAADGQEARRQASLV